MGLLVEGTWQDSWYDTKSAARRFFIYNLVSKFPFMHGKNQLAAHLRTLSS